MIVFITFYYVLIFMFAAALIAIHKVRAEMHDRGCIGSDSSGIVGFEHMVRVYFSHHVLLKTACTYHVIIFLFFYSLIYHGQHLVLW